MKNYKYNPNKIYRLSLFNRDAHFLKGNNLTTETVKEYIKDKFFNDLHIVSVEYVLKNHNYLIRYKDNESDNVKMFEMELIEEKEFNTVNYINKDMTSDDIYEKGAVYVLTYEKEKRMSIYEGSELNQDIKKVIRHDLTDNFNISDVDRITPFGDTENFVYTLKGSDKLYMIKIVKL